jgi:hypothetical protein
MEERLKSGTSTNNLRPSELDTITNHGTSRALVEQATCKSGAQTQDGSKFSNSMENSLSIQLTTRSLMLQEVKTRKVKLLLCTTEMETRTTTPTKDGRLYI